MEMDTCIWYKYILYNGNFWITAGNIALHRSSFHPQPAAVFIQVFWKHILQLLMDYGKLGEILR